MKYLTLLISVYSSFLYGEQGALYSTNRASFEFVKEGDLNIWQRTRNEFHVHAVSFHLESGEYWAKHLLILEEYVAKTHIGIPMLNSNMKLTAWEITSTHAKEKLWEIEAEADQWELAGPEIVLTKYGCCDQPNTTYRYSTATGRLAK